jgi:hypothetical protein
MPDKFVNAGRTVPVSKSVAVTVAPGIAAPVWSVTLPERLADTWLLTWQGKKQSSRTIAESRFVVT